LIGFLEREHKVNHVIRLDLDMQNLDARVEADTGLVNADVAAIPLQDGSIDIAACHLIAGDNPDMEGAKLEGIRDELARVVRPGGLLIASAGDEKLHDIPGFELMFMTDSNTNEYFFRRSIPPETEASTLENR
jgi:SAM-dependent methyltransferase